MMSRTVRIRHPGKLHRKLNIPPDEKIPERELLKVKSEAKRRHETGLEREATFALNARRWHKKRGR